MRKITSLTLWLLLLVLPAANAQLTDKKDTHKKTRKPSGYMGLWDVNLSSGYMRNSKHETYTPTGSEDIRKNSMYVLFHGQESLLSNYWWADKDDTRIKAGFQETVDFGCSYGTETKSGTYHAADEKKKGFGLLFAYEAGFAAVYKVNNNIDVGFTYYPLIASSFSPNRRYAKFRARYTNFMGEFSAFGKTAIELKYLKQSDKDERSMSFYYGISYIVNSEDKVNWVRNNKFLHLSMGMIF